MTTLKPKTAYKVTRPDGSTFTFRILKIRGRWIHGRAGGGYVGAIPRDNVGAGRHFQFKAIRP